MNAILSAKSDSDILIDQEANGGLRNYFLYVLAAPIFLGFPLSLVPCFVWLIDGLVYSRSFQFGAECLGQHAGTHQVLDLEDGNGPSKCRIFYHSLRLTSSRIRGNETAVIRYNYGDPSLGTCQETIQGGNHFRYWVQNGSQRNSSAVFMAFSYEHTLQGMICFSRPPLTRM